jgi:hypothetical protein
MQNMGMDGGVRVEKKKKGGCLRNIAIISIMGCSLLIACAMLGYGLQLMGYGDTKTNDDGLGNVVVIPSRTPAGAASDTPIPLPTDTPIPLPTNTLIPFNTNTPSTISQISEWENTIALTLAMVTDVDVKSVRIADGRANGGERGVIIAFAAPSSEQAAAVGSVWGAVGAAIREYSMDIDAVTLIYGVNENQTTGLIVLQVSDLLAYLNGEITIEELVERAN